MVEQEQAHAGLPKGFGRKLLIEHMDVLFSHADTRSVDELFLHNLLWLNNEQLQGKHAKTVCALMKRCYRRVVTVRAVKKSRAQPPDDSLCITCCVKRPRVVFYGCGHHVLCQPCYLRYAKDMCPVCREPIRDASIIIGP